MLFSSSVLIPTRKNNSYTLYLKHWSRYSIFGSSASMKTTQRRQNVRKSFKPPKKKTEQKNYKLQVPNMKSLYCIESFFALMRCGVNT